MTTVEGLGTVEWAIKNTFLAYLDGVGDASVTTTDGAERLPTGTLRFPVTTATDRLIETAGSALITAHAGELSLEISRPALRVGADGAWSLEWTVGGVSAIRARLLDAAASRPTGGGSWRIADVALTSDGASLFGGSYGPWTRMAPIFVARD